MISNNAEWERGWFYLHNDGAGLPLHRQGAEGEGRLLAPRGVPVFAPSTARFASGRVEGLLTVNSCIKVRLDLQADKSPVVVKGPFFPLVVNPRYRIRGTNV
jgi:hypothetical protein